MADDLAKPDFAYKAFISYSHRDKLWADWLHRLLETYRVPRALAGKPGRDGAVPATLFPVFRDREELPSATDLGQQVNDALQKSAYLIVICSPHSAYSHWVNEEILAYKRLGRANRILALIVDGEPNASDAGSLHLECFPKALRYALDDRGAYTETRLEPIAADVRPIGDGRERAALKIIAGLLGVGFDSLAQRQRARQRREWAVRGTVALGLVVLAGGIGYYAWDQTLRLKTEYYTNFGLAYGVPFGVGRLSPSEAAHRTYTYRLQRRGREVVGLQLENAAHRTLPLTQYANELESEYRGVTQLRIQARHGRAQVVDYLDILGQVQHRAIYSFSGPPAHPDFAIVRLEDKDGHGWTVLPSAVEAASFGVTSDGLENPTRITQYRLSFNDRGWTTRKRFEDHWGSQATRPDGVWGFRYSYTTDGQPESLTLLADDSVLASLAAINGGPPYTALRFAYEAGALTSVQWLDRGGQPMDNGRGYAELTRAYDKRGNKIAQAYLGPDGRCVVNYRGVARDVWTHRAGDGAEETATSLDCAGTPVIAVDPQSGEPRLYATARYRLDTLGQVAGVSYLDPAGLPVNSNLGYGRIDYVRDALGRITRESVFLADGAPAVAPAGFHAHNFVFDANGNPVTETFEDAAGHPDMSQGFAAMHKTFTGNGDQTSLLYVDAAGRAVDTYRGYARVAIVWGDNGKPAEMRYYSADGRPALDLQSGCALRTYAYDHDDNRTAEACFGPDGAPVIGSAGWFRRVHMFDGNGHQIEQAFFAVDGRAVTTANGPARSLWLYDEAGRLEKVMNFPDDTTP